MEDLCDACLSNLKISAFLSGQSRSKSTFPDGVATSANPCVYHPYLAVMYPPSAGEYTPEVGL